jgi:hypothetical protein
MNLLPVSMPINHFMFRTGKSMPQNEDAMFALETNMRDLGSLKNSFFTMEKKIIPASVMARRTLGINVSSDTLKMFDFPTNEGAYSLPILSSHRKTNLSTMLKFEGIRIKNSDKINNLLVFGQGYIDRGQGALLHTAFHEIGHAVSSESGVGRFPERNKFLNFNEQLEFDFRTKKLSSFPQDAANEWKNKFINAVSEMGVEEARADSFAGLISKTAIGKSIMAQPDETPMDIISPYSFFDANNQSFDVYSSDLLEMTKKNSFYDTLAAQVDFDEIQELANMEAHGKFMGSVNYR